MVLSRFVSGVGLGQESGYALIAVSGRRIGEELASPQGEEAQFLRFRKTMDSETFIFRGIGWPMLVCRSENGGRCAELHCA